MCRVRAVRFLRKMRGGAQAHLVEGADGSFSVVKSVSNPPVRGTLVNELTAAILFEQVGTNTAKSALVRMREEFTRSNGACRRL